MMLKLANFLNGGLDGSHSPHIAQSSVHICPDVFPQIVSSSYLFLTVRFDHFFSIISGGHYLAFCTTPKDSPIS